VQVEAILHRVGADARVQFPQSRAPTDEDLAEAVIRFASALARGDESAFGSLLDPSARSVLDELLSSGDWEEATARIEAVRVFWVKKGVAEYRPPTGPLAGLSPEMFRDPAALQEAVRTMTEMLSAEQRAEFEQAQQALTAAIAASPGDRDAMAAAAQQFMRRIQPILLAAASGAADQGPVDPEAYGIGLAIQEPGSAYALLWIARRSGDGWRFAALPSALASRPRASDWDAVSDPTASAASLLEGLPAEGLPGVPSLPAPGEPTTPRAPIGG
jgi:hypothetical protein